MSRKTGTPVVRTVTVAASLERAFKVFTEQFGTWWPKEYSIGEVDMAPLSEPADAGPAPSSVPGAGRAPRQPAGEPVRAPGWRR